MNLYDVIVPEWHVGCPMRFRDVRADTPHDAYRYVLALVNKMAGYDYADSLPLDTKVVLMNHDFVAA